MNKAVSNSLCAALLVGSMLFSSGAANLPAAMAYSATNTTSSITVSESVKHAEYADSATQYDDALSWAIEKGIITGKKEDFKANKPLSAGEFAAILYRAFYATELSSDIAREGDWAINYATGLEFLGVLSVDNYKLMKKNGVSRETMWNEFVRGTDLAPYPAWMYDGSNPTIDETRDIAYAMTAMGLYSKKMDSKGIPTKGETIMLLYRLMNHLYAEQKLPEKWVNAIDLTVNDPRLTWTIRNAIYADLTKIPQKYIDAFNKEGWRIDLVYSMGAAYPDHASANGVCFPAQKLLAVATFYNSADTHTLLHEMGHAIQTIVHEDYFTGHMYQEADAFAKVQKSDYCKTSKEEMFADAFRYIINNMNSEEKMAELQKECPYTYHSVVDGYLNADGLIDQDYLNDLTHEYFNRLYNEK